MCPLESKSFDDVPFFRLQEIKQTYNYLRTLCSIHHNISVTEHHVDEHGVVLVVQCPQ